MKPTFEKRLIRLEKRVFGSSSPPSPPVPPPIRIRPEEWVNIHGEMQAKDYMWADGRVGHLNVAVPDYNSGPQAVNTKKLLQQASSLLGDGCTGIDTDGSGTWWAEVYRRLAETVNLKGGHQIGGFNQYSSARLRGGTWLDDGPRAKNAQDKLGGSFAAKAAALASTGLLAQFSPTYGPLSTARMDPLWVLEDLHKAGVKSTRWWCVWEGWTGAEGSPKGSLTPWGGLREKDFESLPAKNWWDRLKWAITRATELDIRLQLTAFDWSGLQHGKTGWARHPFNPKNTPPDILENGQRFDPPGTMRDWKGRTHASCFMGTDDPTWPLQEGFLRELARVTYGTDHIIELQNEPRGSQGAVLDSHLAMHEVLKNEWDRLDSL
jgi:hypothetical protein